MSDLPPSPFSDPSPWTPAPSPAAPPPPPVGLPGQPRLFELRPLSLGEILDRTFSLYRQRFWLYTGLSTITAGCASLFALASLLLGRSKGLAAIFNPVAAAPPPQIRPEQIARYGITFAVVIFVVMILYLVAYGVTQAATVAALSAVYVGEETSIGIALKRVRGHWFRYILIMMWQSWSGLWPFFVLIIPAIGFFAVPSLRGLGGLFIFLAFGALIYAPFAIIRNSLGVVSSAVEDLSVPKAMRRSKFLVSGHKARVLGIMLLVTVLGWVAGVLQQIVGTFAALTTGPTKIGIEAVVLLVTFATTAMVTPVGPIAMTLFYIDERVRKEGFDLEVLMARGAPPPGPEELPSPFTSELA